MNKQNFNNKKAIAVAGLLLSIQGGNCDKYWFNKVMYYIERESLIKNGQPLFSDDLYSIPYGPIASAVNDNIDLCSYDDIDTPWNKYFILSSNVIRLLKEPDFSIISQFEKTIIINAFKKFRGWGFGALHDYFEKLPEYKRTNSRIPISYEEILLGAGYDKEEIVDTLEEISYLTSLESTLNCAEY